ncbi:MAG TPA: hypothetical protein VNS59_00645 [Lysobacter sp.]|jgi:hypothetical protein|nr:hypothetical protein [Lysobacter sp.]
MTRIAACLLLVCVSATAAPRDIRMQGANGDGGRCPEVAAAAAEANATSGKAHPASPAPRTKVAKPASARGESETPRISAPRWHSFLPGMFR